MSKKQSGLRASLLLMLVLLVAQISVSLPLAQEAPAAPSQQNETAAAANAADNDTAAKIGEPAALPGVQGIWKVSLRGMDIILALNQSGGSLFGSAKFEGDHPWNGVLAGSLTGKAVQVALAAVERNMLVSTYMNGTADGDNMTGSYIRSESSGKATRGEFSATRISPDTAGYTPAPVVLEPAPDVQKPQQSTLQNASAAQNTNASSGTSTAQPTIVKKSRFKDVTELAKGIDPNILPRMAQI